MKINGVELSDSIEESKNYAKEFGVNHIVVNIDNFKVEKFIENNNDKLTVASSLIATISFNFRQTF